MCDDAMEENSDNDAEDDEEETELSEERGLLPDTTTSAAVPPTSSQQKKAITARAKVTRSKKIVLNACYVQFLMDYITVNYDWYPEDNTIVEFDLHRHNMDATVDDVWNFVKEKYNFDEYSDGRYVTYESRSSAESIIWGMHVIEAIAMKSPPPASKTLPKLLEPGRRIAIKGREGDKCECL